MFVCKLPYCSTTFTKFKKNVRHSNRHIGQYTILYKDCKDFTNQKDIPKCGKEFRFKFQLIRHHLLIHPQLFDNVNWIKCKENGCGFKSKLMRSFTRHRKSHTRPWKCLHCLKTFDRIYYLSHHMNTHTKEVLHQCVWPGCDYKTYNKTGLDTHESKNHRYYRFD
jgi:hypothetical protein